MSHILITGGTGYIGIHTTLNLLENGLSVTILDSNVNSKKNVFNRLKSFWENSEKSLKNNLNFYQGDILDLSILEKIFLEANLKGSPINGVIHFAGLKSLSDSLIDPIKYWKVNVGGAIFLCDVMLKNQCSTLIFSSSASVYGHNSLIVDELSELKPLHPYGNTKVTVETMLLDAYKHYSSDLKIINLRYFNPIGAHPSGLFGEYPLLKDNSNLFPRICEVALGNDKFLKIFGDDWPTNDGTCVRDYIHIMDVAEAHKVALIHALNSKKEFQVFNIGRGFGLSILELINIFEKVNNVKIPYKFFERREGDIHKLVADNSKFKEHFGWLPSKSIEDACMDGWKWILNENNF